MLSILLTCLAVAAQTPSCSGRDWLNCRAKNDAYQAANIEGVIRHGKTLVVGSVGQAAVYTDRYFANDEVYNYKNYLRGRLQKSGPGSRWLVIDTPLWDGQHIDLANLDTGAKVTVEGGFLFAPNRKRFSTVSADGGTGYFPNQVEIYSLGSEIKSEYRMEYDGDNVQPVDGVWLGDDVFSYFQQVGYDASCRKKQILLRLQSGNWNVEEKAAVPCN